MKKVLDPDPNYKRTEGMQNATGEKEIGLHMGHCICLLYAGILLPGILFRQQRLVFGGNYRGAAAATESVFFK
jgi:hypothetical protein